MRKSVMFAGGAASAVFVLGYAAGQIFGIGSTSAAANPSFTMPAAQLFARHAGHGLAPAAALGPRADGKVSAVNGDTITVTPDGNRGPSPGNEYGKVTTITVIGSTTYDSGPGQASSKSAIKVGSFIVAFGNVSSNGTSLTATRVSVMAGSHGPCPGMGGARTSGQSGAFFSAPFSAPGPFR